VNYPESADQIIVPPKRLMPLEGMGAGAGVPSANRIRLLRDADGDGAAEVSSVFLEGLDSPFGMALVGSDFYIANTDAVMRFPYTSGLDAHQRGGYEASLRGPLFFTRDRSATQERPQKKGLTRKNICIY